MRAGDIDMGIASHAFTDHQDHVEYFGAHSGVDEISQDFISVEENDLKQNLRPHFNALICLAFSPHRYSLPSPRVSTPTQMLPGIGKRANNDLSLRASDEIDQMHRDGNLEDKRCGAYIIGEGNRSGA